jgi:hypothetical protein
MKLLEAAGADGPSMDVKICDHFGVHPKTAGRTFTGGADVFLKEIFSQRLGVL